MTTAIIFGIILLAIAVACALIPEMLSIMHRFRRPRAEERHVIRVQEETEPRRARPKLKREAAPSEDAPPAP